MKTNPKHNPPNPKTKQTQKRIAYERECIRYSSFCNKSCSCHDWPCAAWPCETGFWARNTSFALLLTVISKAGFVGVRPVQLFRAPHSEGSCAWSLIMLCGHHLEIINHLISEFVFCKWSQMGQWACAGDDSLVPCMVLPPLPPSIHSMLPFGALGYPIFPFCLCLMDTATFPLGSPVHHGLGSEPLEEWLDISMSRQGVTFPFAL